jgi:hypothetical protein
MSITTRAHAKRIACRGHIDYVYSVAGITRVSVHSGAVRARAVASSRMHLENLPLQAISLSASAPRAPPVVPIDHARCVAGLSDPTHRNERLR